jgi:serine/threonine protein kinase
MELASWSDPQELVTRLRRMPLEECVSDAISQAEISILSPSDDPASMGRIGMFEVRAVIGRGGMGTVYKAIDPSLGRTVAIKVLRPELASIGSARRRFSLESRAMASITHPNVVPVYAVDEHRGLPFMAMEYVPGGTLESRLRKEGPMDVVSIVRIAHQVAQALGAAHECGLVHRDIKPGNILIDRGIERVRVADFGLVRVSDDASMTRSGLIAGTPQFMAPEQVRGEACDGRTDLFSLGCVLYALCVGHPPFRAESPYAAMQRIVHDSERPMSELRPEIPNWLGSLIHQLLAKRPEDRIDSSSSLVGILESELSHLQNPISTPTPTRDWIRIAESRASTRSTHWPWYVFSGVGLAAMAWMLIGLSWPIIADRFRIRDGSLVNSQSTTPPSPSRPSIAAVPLWDRDGCREVIARMKQVQSEMHSGMEPLDATQNTLMQIRVELDALERRDP